MSNIKIDIVDNGITTLATAGKYCDRNVEIAVNVPSSGGGSIEVEPFVLSGSCDYACGGAMASKYIELFSDTVSTKDVTSCRNMFSNSTLEKVPFDINIKGDKNLTAFTSMFDDAHYLKELPAIKNAYVYQLDKIFNNCYRLKTIPEDFSDDWDFSGWNTYKYPGLGRMFYNCYSLRYIPKSFLQKLWGAAATSASYSVYNSGFSNCYVLDELEGLPITTAIITANMFSSTFDSCCRLKNIKFDINEDNTCKTAQWQKQTISLNSVGFNNFYSQSVFTQYNSGITADKQVKDDATYQALKNDPDYFTDTGLSQYSRYNHDSAVNTINTLPDTSAYLATAGGTNTIKFLGVAGALTDGGAINTLTEEEIAVATAKGWTVSMS